MCFSKDKHVASSARGQMNPSSSNERDKWFNWQLSSLPSLPCSPSSPDPVFYSFFFKSHTHLWNSHSISSQRILYCTCQVSLWPRSEWSTPPGSFPRSKMLKDRQNPVRFEVAESSLLFRMRCIVLCWLLAQPLFQQKPHPCPPQSLSAFTSSHYAALSLTLHSIYFPNLHSSSILLFNN